MQNMHYPCLGWAYPPPDYISSAIALVFIPLECEKLQIIFINCTYYTRILILDYSAIFGLGSDINPEVCVGQN